MFLPMVLYFQMDPDLKHEKHSAKLLDPLSNLAGKRTDIILQNTFPKKHLSVISYDIFYTT